MSRFLLILYYVVGMYSSRLPILNRTFYLDLYMIRHHRYYHLHYLLHHYFCIHSVSYIRGRLKSSLFVPCSIPWMSDVRITFMTLVIVSEFIVR